jgi:hypothetical protein
MCKTIKKHNNNKCKKVKKHINLKNVYFCNGCSNLIEYSGFCSEKCQNNFEKGYLDLYSFSDLKIKKNKGKWNKLEYINLREGIKLFNTNWKTISILIPTRTIKQIKVFNRSNKIKKGKWSDIENKKFMKTFKKFGKNWEQLSYMMKTRTIKQIKKHYYHIKKTNSIQSIPML